MEVDKLRALSPVDGRYFDQVEKLSNYFSEFGFMKYRVLIEVEYFIALSRTLTDDLPELSPEQTRNLRIIYEKFGETDVRWIKEQEKITNHDVKAVEYYLKKRLDEFHLSPYTEFVHFGLTSQDVNNTAVPLLFKDALTQIVLPAYRALNEDIKELAGIWKDVPMLARTHGQPASPTRLGKELMVFFERVEAQLASEQTIPHSGKFGGATGNFNAHHAAYPQLSWPTFADSFLADLGLVRQRYTTQIEHYDQLAARLDVLARINIILTDFAQDLWQYIAMNYFMQRVNEQETGSSAMPHKVNPIDFENAEGNFGVAGALFSHLASKLPKSRLQRDLTDSTVLRNLGVPIAHTLVALNSLRRGISKLILNEPVMRQDLENNWPVVAEAIQTVLRREKFPQPYEALKRLTRSNEPVGKVAIHRFIDELEVSDELKVELKSFSPFNYLGVLPD